MHDVPEKQDLDACGLSEMRTMQELETTRVLLDVLRTLSASIELDELLQRIADVTLALTGLPRAFVNLIEEGRRVLRPGVATGGLAAPEGASLSFEELSETAVRAIAERRTALLDYDGPDVPERDRQIAEANKARLVLFVPLLVGRDIVGHIAVDEPGERHAFTSREIELVEAIASQAAIVIRNAQLYAEANESARLRDALHEIDASIHSTLDFDAVMQEALDRGLEALDCRSGAIEIRRDERWVVAYQRGFPELVGVPMSDVEAPNAARVAASGGPLAIENVWDESTVNVYVGRQGLRSVLGVPFLVRGKLVGCVLFYAQGEVRHFSRPEMDFADKFGASLSLALENARLYQAERDMIERLREKDLAIRRAYVDVIDAVTGGKLVLLTPEELKDLFGELINAPARVECEAGMAEDRHRMQSLLASLDRQVRDVDGLVLAASEAITNACKHARSGRWSVRVNERCVQVAIQDMGAGIDFKTLPKATLAAGFSTKVSLGMGFTIMLEICDRILLATEPGFTCIVLEMNFVGAQNAAHVAGSVSEL